MSENYFSNSNNNMKSSRKFWHESLIDYFKLIKVMEDKIDLIRASLCSDKNFNPKELFNYIDKRNKDNITLNDLKLILQENNIIFKEDNLRKFIHNFDKDNDFCLDYNEFIGIIFPRKDKYLQKKFITSIQYNNIKINFNIINIFCNLLVEEMKLIDGCNKVVNKIQGFNGFTLYEAFLEIVNGEGAHINENNLAEFLARNNIEIIEEDAHQLMFRLDKDNDGKISYDEFQDMFLLLQNEINMKNMNDDNKNTYKISKNYNINNNKIVNNSNNYMINNRINAKSKININEFNNDDINIKININNNEDEKNNNIFYNSNSHSNNYYNKNQYNNYNYNKYNDEDIISPIRNNIINNINENDRNNSNNSNNKQINKENNYNNSNIKLNKLKNTNPNILYDSLENSKNQETQIYNNYNYNNKNMKKNYYSIPNNNVGKKRKKNNQNHLGNKKNTKNQENSKNLEEKIRKIFQIPKEKRLHTPIKNKNNEESKEKEINSKSPENSLTNTQLHYDYSSNQKTEYSNINMTVINSKKYNSSRISPFSHLNLNRTETDFQNDNIRTQKNKSNKDIITKKDVKMKIPCSSKKKEYNKNSLCYNDNKVKDVNVNTNNTKREKKNFNYIINNKGRSFSSNKKIINNLFQDNHSFNNYRNNDDYLNEENKNDINNNDINYKKIKKEMSLQDLILNYPFQEKKKIINAMKLKILKIKIKKKKI